MRNRSTYGRLAYAISKPLFVAMSFRANQLPIFVFALTPKGIRSIHTDTTNLNLKSEYLIFNNFPSRWYEGMNRI